MTSILKAVSDAGVSVWLDDLSRGMLDGAELTELVDTQHVVGVTTNPSIFAKALKDGDAYQQQLNAMVRSGATVDETLWALMITDVQRACDVLAPIAEATDGVDGRVSLEVDPGLARDAEATLQLAAKLHQQVDRSNLMIKIPATVEGLKAIEDALAQGISVNVTLIFHANRYEKVLLAFREGLKRAHSAGLDISSIHSVASFFISRVDAAIDPMLADIGTEQAAALRGKAGLAGAHLGYEKFLEHEQLGEWQALAAAGAHQQRPLWASTSVKDDSYAPEKYITGLVAPSCVNTIPRDTLTFCANNNASELTMMQNQLDEAREVAAELRELGIELENVTNTLEEEGVSKFAKAWEQLTQTVEDQMSTNSTAPGDIAAQVPTQSTSSRSGSSFVGTIELSETLRPGVGEVVSRLVSENFASRLAKQDATLWGPEAEDEASKRLGWTNLPSRADEIVEKVHALRDELVAEGLTRIVLCGMGGSSLAPEVICDSQGMRLVVLDSTDPEQVHRAVTTGLERTAIVVSSKSGSTVETDSARRIFTAAFESVGIDPAERIIVVTDPGSPLDELVSSGKARAVFHADPTVGGRYSALSAFGLVPSGLAGANIAGLVAEAKAEAETLAADDENNVALILGAAMGNPAEGRDKLIIVPEQGCPTGVGHWIEQLVAESTGKENTGVLPVVVKNSQAPEVVNASADCTIVHVYGHDAPITAPTGQALAISGTLGELFQIWESATAVNGHLLAINPFDQPDVESAKKAARELLSNPPQAGSPLMEEGSLKAFGDSETFGTPQSLGEAVGSLLGQLDSTKGYLAVMVYADREGRSDLEHLRDSLASRTGRPTTFGWGPRFLHSTGQYHKGGPATGVYLIITSDHPADVAIPDQEFSFGELITAQAFGDAQVLRDHGRPVLRLHVTGPDGWKQLTSLLSA